MSFENRSVSSEDHRVEEMMGSAESAVPHQSRLGKASFFLGLTSIVMILVFGCVIPIGVLALGDYTDVDVPFSTELFGIVAPLGFLSVPVISLTGVCLGIAGLLRKNCRRSLAIVGLVLSSLILLAFVLLCLWWIAAIEGMVAC